jgi:hypothetical protein
VLYRPSQHSRRCGTPRPDTDAAAAATVSGQTCLLLLLALPLHIATVAFRD